jgi:hypothetical protein
VNSSVRFRPSFTIRHTRIHGLPQWAARSGTPLITIKKFSAARARISEESPAHKIEMSVFSVDTAGCVFDHAFMPKCPRIEGGKTLPRQRKRQRRGRGRIVIAAVVVLSLPFLGWAAANALSGDDPGGGSAATDGTSRLDGADAPSRGDSSTPGSFEIAQAARDSVSACASRLTAGDAYVEKAGVGIGHWGEHVQARTDMLNGTVGQEDMRAIWKRTRLSGPDDVAQATAALEAYQALPACEELDGIDAPGSIAEQAAACLERETAMTAAVDAATAGLQDWANHLNAMAAHADGEMTASAAQDLWVASWEAAPTNIGAYDDARAQLAAAPSCG